MEVSAYEQVMHLLTSHWMYAEKDDKCGSRSKCNCIGSPLRCTKIFLQPDHLI